MKTSDFNFDLPKDLIAQKPTAQRDESRLLVMNRTTGDLEDQVFSNIVDHFGSSDVLVLNDSRVYPARLLFDWNGKEAELLFVEQVGERLWMVMGRPGKMIKEGLIIDIGQLEVRIVGIEENGLRRVEINQNYAHLMQFLDKRGVLPLPPYIEEYGGDMERYQTVYSGSEGSIAAPTAGLHFTPEILAELKKRGVEIVKVTLNVGLGTFLPVKVDDIADHFMHSEKFFISEDAALRLNRAVSSKKRIVAVGTTSVRVLESNYDGQFHAGHYNTNIFISPGYKWKVVQGLITNFHLPKSTLIMLVSSFAGRKSILRAYQHAIEQKYRFFSFGDAMLII